MSASPEVMIAAAGERTRRIMLGTGVNSLTYHHPFILADRIMQLDHLTAGRVMLGMGPGQLPSDAFMMGIDPRRQRDMMIEAAEVISGCCAARWSARRPTGSPSTAPGCNFVLTPARHRARRRVDLVTLRGDARRPARLAMLSLSATDPSGFDALDANWGHFERTSAEHGNPVDRERWRVVASMHLAETREQAEREMEHGVLALNAYMERMGNRKLPGPDRRVRRSRIGRPTGCRTSASPRSEPPTTPSRPSAVDRKDRWLRHFSLPRPQLRRLAGDQAVVRAVRRVRDPRVPGHERQSQRQHRLGRAEQREVLRRDAAGHP